MPYSDISILPLEVKKVLPKEAQEIFLAAYNRGWAEAPMFGARQSRSPREERATKVAWASVRKEYRLNEETGQWEKK